MTTTQKPPAPTRGPVQQPQPLGKPAAKPPAKPPAPKPPVLSQGQQSVYDLMNQTLTSWGLTSLAPHLQNRNRDDDTAPDTLALARSKTQAYKVRFAGNAERVKNGLPELNPAQYIGLEEQYQNVLRSYGLPAGFYDKPTDFI